MRRVPALLTPFIEALESRALLADALGCELPLAPAPEDTAAASGARSDMFAARQQLTARFAPATRRATQRYEIRFLTHMIDHHQMAVLMSPLAVEKGTHPEFRQLNQNIVATQVAEIQQMQGWLQNWYGIAHTPDPTGHHGGAGGLARLRRLTGDRFEIVYNKQMIRHHWKGVLMARQALRRAEHPELRALAQAIIDVQTQEIRLMQGWLRDFYGIRRFGPRV